MLDLQSEEFPPTGGIAGEGARRALGRPRLHQLEVLMREAAQNSLDARDDDHKTVQFYIDVREMSGAQQLLLRGEVFGQRGPRKHLHLNEVLERGNLSVVVIADRGTKGLAGPTRTDRLVDEDSPRNFIEFFRNVGRLRDGPVGGGTYGFGKASLYVASEAGVILVHTRCQLGSRYETRLMAAALGQQYRARDQGKLRNFTGRHWWGRLEAGVVEPLTGVAASKLAKQLGFPDFEADETGTSIMIIAPRLAGDAIPDAGQRLAACKLMAQTVQWYCWPHLLGGQRGGMVLSAVCDGKVVAIPAIEDDHLLRAYALAYKGASAMTRLGQGSAQRLDAWDLDCHNPKQHLGRLALVRVHSNLPTPATFSDEEGGHGAVPTGVPSHIALMRKPKLVVRYLKYPAASDGAGFVGVFVAADELNETFAEAEPVTHDEWNADSMEDRHGKTFVRVTYRRMEERIREYFNPSPGVSVKSDGGAGLGRLSRLLGGLLPDSEGPGAEAQPLPPGSGGGRGGGARRNARVEILGGVDLSSELGQTMATFAIDVNTTRELRAIVLRCSPRVVTADGANETETPLGAEASRVVRWRGDAFRIPPDGASKISISPGVNGQLLVTVTVPNGAAVSIFVDVSGEDISGEP